MVLAVTLFAGSAAAKPFPGLIVLPGATSAEGIATGIGSTFYAGDLFAGDIFRGDLRGGLPHSSSTRRSVGWPPG